MGTPIQQELGRAEAVEQFLNLYWWELWMMPSPSLSLEKEKEVKTNVSLLILDPFSPPLPLLPTTRP